MATHVLEVKTRNQPVGEIRFDSREYTYDFTYAREWLERTDAFALSPHIALPNQAGQDEELTNLKGPTRPGAVERFLQNLLPEGRALDVVSINNQISKDNVFGLVALLGKEPAGALSFTMAGLTETEAADQQPERRTISHQELSHRIQQRDYLPFPIWDGKVRLSVAGFQDKLQVLVEGEQLSLADGCLASTHILKPESHSPVTPCMVANEHFCMTLAAKMGLDVAPVTIKRIPEPILLIERFDRKVITALPGSGSANPHHAIAVQRQHVIDGCQALDLPVSHKYECNFGHGRDVRHIRDGVSFEKLFTSLEFDNPLAARLSMLRWALLQLLIGNSDAHGKNISFFMHANQLIPAPFYDLVSVSVYGAQFEQEMAMGYGDVFLIDEIGAFDLADFAHRTAIPTRLLAREMTHLANKAKSLALELADSNLYTQTEKNLVQAIAQFVLTQADRMLKMAPLVPKVDRAML